MNNNELFTANEALENRFDDFELTNTAETDITLDNVNPWLLIATYTGSIVA